ncbi:tetratricopeptide repeat protein, partial [bacterium]
MADLAAQGSAGKDGAAMCERCLAPLAPGEAFCPECGAPTGESLPAADSAVHNELAGANLLRLRGDLDGSEKALLGILRRFPNDPYAHEMLGDVCAARGETERAKEWYELALDLAPNSADIRRKLEHTDDKVEEQVTADTAETLGLPPSTPPAA